MERNKEIFEIAELTLKYLRGELDLSEETRLNAWLEKDERNRTFLDSLTDEATMEECVSFISSIDTPAALQKVLLQMQARHQPPSTLKSGILKRMSWWKAAAAIFLFLTVLTVLWQQYTKRAPADNVIAGQQQKADVLPGGDKATLLLADGSVIKLENTGDNTVREENGIRIKQQDGEVIYEVMEEGTAVKETAWNTISTPRGGQYQLKLPDGSKVWLNAGSDLRFPPVFAGSARVVELKGEAYFEVAHNKNQPFSVKVNGLTVEVLGTHFNVKAYEDEDIVHATLIEGAVKVKVPSGEELLFPGKQASMDKGTGKLAVKTVNTDDVIAWKDGLFRFSRESVDNVMKKIARWYDVEVTYKGVRPGTEFSGMISRDVPLSQVLEMLEMTGGARFRMEGKSVTVLRYDEEDIK